MRGTISISFNNATHKIVQWIEIATARWPNSNFSVKIHPKRIISELVLLPFRGVGCFILFPSLFNIVNCFYRHVYLLNYVFQTFTGAKKSDNRRANSFMRRHFDYCYLLYIFHRCPEAFAIHCCQICLVDTVLRSVTNVKKTV